jgi:hypothetical protein
MTILNRPFPRHVRLNIAAAFLLLTGMTAAIYIYLTVQDVVESDLVSQFEQSKKYRHELEAYGGKINVLAADFISWFTGLWRGKSLAFTIMVITLAVSGTLFYFARLFAADHPGDVRNADHSS